MTRRLILMRHAKSSWDDPRLDDIDRSLNARGQRNAKAMGTWLRTRGYFPDQALVSVAARTQQTFDLVTQGLGMQPELRVIDGLYLASELRILQELKKATGQTVLLIAHNPGIGEFAARFAQNPQGHGDFLRYPTCATTVYEIGAATWPEVRFGDNPVLEFAIPREIDI
ncbi:SixA phosphatase family protein [Celeribacter persicus]|uniref:Phosphohistidine phosphatase n=1 Tax=Celeribacter persicus TaxID=1651082 RepID=A0A2T5HX25_9RHOB|nr:histidine phosphatase family protein [Celeribacter persicus]PTQ76018.1 phosphohistidine phosphatase [Celeribacter persicus]